MDSTEAGIEIVHGLHARIERWQKLSIGQPQLDKDDDPSFDASNASVCVKKTRSLFKFEVHDETIRVVPGNAMIESGTGVEITGLLIDDVPYWTIGFEAFASADSDLELILRVTCQRALNGGPVDVLSRAESCGYPQWIESVLKTSPANR